MSRILGQRVGAREGGYIELVVFTVKLFGVIISNYDATLPRENNCFPSNTREEGRRPNPGEEAMWHAKVCRLQWLQPSTIYLSYY